MPQESQSGESTFPATDLASAILLAAAGGILDAVVYLNHGHVFANAMTGNVIFLGIAAVDGDWQQALRHVVPICAFLCGVAAANRVHNAPLRHSASIVLVLEASAIFAIGLFPPSLPQTAYTAVVAFVSAFQVATFRHVGRFSYNSTFVTGNLRMVAEGVFNLFFCRTPEARSKGGAQATKLGSICAAFLVGAVAGALAARRFPVHALLVAEGPLLAALLLTLRNPVKAVRT